MHVYGMGGPNGASVAYLPGKVRTGQEGGRGKVWDGSRNPGASECRAVP